MPDQPPNHRGATFVEVDFTGATFRDCDLRHVKVVDSWLGDVHLSGLVERMVVNDVDVAAYVESQLDERHPERVVVRSMQTADDHRAAWAMIEAMWDDTLARVGRLPTTAVDERVDDEWSLSETLRHLVFCIDAWATRTILDRVDYHPYGLCHSSHSPEAAVAIGIDLAARPPFDVVREVHAERVATVRGIVAGLDAGELARTCSAPPAPGYPITPRTVRACLSVVMREAVEHHRYAVRDLAVLERRNAAATRRVED